MAAPLANPGPSGSCTAPVSAGSGNGGHGAGPCGSAEVASSLSAGRADGGGPAPSCGASGDGGDGGAREPRATAGPEAAGAGEAALDATAGAAQVGAGLIVLKTPRHPSPRRAQRAAGSVRWAARRVSRVGGGVRESPVWHLSPSGAPSLLSWTRSGSDGPPWGSRSAPHPASCEKPVQGQPLGGRGRGRVQIGRASCRERVSSPV